MPAKMAKKKKKKKKSPRPQKFRDPSYDRLFFLWSPELSQENFRDALVQNSEELRKLNELLGGLEKAYPDELEQLKEIVCGNKKERLAVFVGKDGLQLVSQKTMEGLNPDGCSNYVEPLERGRTIVQAAITKLIDDKKMLAKSKGAIRDFRDKVEKYLGLSAWKDWDSYCRFTQNLTLLGYPKKEATAYRKTVTELRQLRSLLETTLGDHEHRYEFAHRDRTTVVCSKCRKQISVKELKLTVDLPSQAEIKRKLKFLKDGKQLAFEVTENEFTEGATLIQKVQPLLKRKAVQTLLEEIIRLEEAVGKTANLKRKEHWETLLVEVPHFFCKEKDPNWILDFDFHNYKKKNEWIDEALMEIRLYQGKPTEFVAYLKQHKKMLEHQYQARLDNVPLPKMEETILTEGQLKILFETALFLEGRFGRTRLMEMLKGKDSDMARAYDFMSYRHFGSFKQMTQVKLIEIIDEMIRQRYMDTVDYEYPKVVLTEKGRLLCEKLKRLNGKKAKLILDTLSFETVLQMLVFKEIEMKDVVKYVKKRYEKEGLSFFKLVMDTPSVRQVEVPNIQDVLVAMIDEQNVPFLRYHHVWSKDTKFGELVNLVLEKYDKRVSKGVEQVVS